MILVSKSNDDCLYKVEDRVIKSNLVLGSNYSDYFNRVSLEWDPVNRIATVNLMQIHNYKHFDKFTKKKLVDDLVSKIETYVKNNLNLTKSGRVSKKLVSIKILAGVDRSDMLYARGYSYCGMYRSLTIMGIDI